MSKAIKWQIPFVSTIDKIQYRIDIYAEGYTGTPIQLTGGTNPIKTEEDKSDDFFAPVRGQTGNIEVVTKLPNGGTLDINDLLPANNIDHPVRLVSISGNTETIEWQGFMSCEAFSQNYTAVPDTFSFPIISVLEAMASVDVNITYINGLSYICDVLHEVLAEIDRESGMTNLTHVNFSYSSFSILNAEIDTAILFERKEYNNENTTTYFVKGISCKEALFMLAKYMGWCVRENKTEVYLGRVWEEIGLYRCEMSNFWASLYYAASQKVENTTISIQNYFDGKWRGTGNQLSIMQGAKTVSVNANLKKYDLNIEIPDCPVNDISTIYKRLWKYAGDGDWLYLLANKNAIAYSNLSFAYYKADMRYSYNHFEAYGQSTINNVLSHMAVGTYSTAKQEIQGGQLNLYTWHAGAFLCKYDWEETGTATAHDTENALYCIFFPHSLSYGGSTTDFDPSQVGPIFSINNVTNFHCYKGYLRLTAAIDTVYQWPSGDYTVADLIHSSEMDYEWFVGMELQFGSEWWNGSSWQLSQCRFNARMKKNGFKDNWVDTMDILETTGLLIPITENMSGLLTLKIWPMASPTNYGTNSGVLEIAFSDLNIDYLLPNKATLTDRSENHYFRLLNKNFRDEIDVDTDLASDQKNEPSPSILMATYDTPLTETMYIKADETVESRRPEVDLLNRLAAYYGAARQRLSLIVEHPTAAPLPLLRLNGINDGKVYLPLAESRDWQQDTSTLQCFETPSES